MKCQRRRLTFANSLPPVMSSTALRPHADLPHAQTDCETQPKLPVELLDRICHFVNILHVDEQGRTYRQIQDTNALWSLSLVNSTFQILAQHCLFSYISLPDAHYGHQTDPFTPFHSLIRESPRLASCVRSLAIWELCIPTIKPLVKILESLTKVEALRFSPASLNTWGLPWSKVPVRVKDALHTHIFPRLIFLCLGKLRSSPLIAILSACPELERIRLEFDVTLAGETLVDQCETQTHPLQSVDLHMCTLGTIGGMVGALERAGCHRIHSLRLCILLDEYTQRNVLGVALSRATLSILTALEISGNIAEKWLEDENIGGYLASSTISMTNQQADSLRLCNMPGLRTLRVSLNPHLFFPADEGALDESTNGCDIALGSHSTIIPFLTAVLTSVSSTAPHPLKFLQIDLFHPRSILTQTRTSINDQDELWSPFDHAVADNPGLGQSFELLVSVSEHRHYPDDPRAPLDINMIRHCLYRRMPIAGEKGIMHFERGGVAQSY